MGEQNDREQLALFKAIMMLLWKNTGMESMILIGI